MGLSETKHGEPSGKRRTPSAPQPVGREQLRQAAETLRKYREGKRTLERRMLENERWWIRRHGEGGPEQSVFEPKSAWLVNVILSKHADAADALPQADFLPRAADDVREAEMLTKIVPSVLDRNDFERVWSDCWWKKLKSGTAVYGVFWDKTLQNGLGDIAIRAVDPLRLYWEPGVTDIQKSRNLFYTELADNETLAQTWPQLAGKLGKTGSGPAEDLFGGVSGKSVVVDWYRKSGNVLHYCKFVGETVLFATENEEAFSKTGLYAHGEYPFVFDVMYPEEGTPAGFGCIDLCKDSQRQIDLMNGAIAANCLAAATPRWLIRGDGGINEEEYADWSRPFVHVQGSLDEQAVKPVPVTLLNGNYLSVLQEKIAEMKETAGNRDVSNGGAPSGVTAAAAIAAMQEQSGKLSRDLIRNSYRCFRKLAYLITELIRQFYDVPRRFRITGEAGPEYLLCDNRTLRKNMPVFDIAVTAEKQNPYSRQSANELALKLYSAGFFRPENREAAIACAGMMDFHGKDALVRYLKARENPENGKNGDPLRCCRPSVARTAAESAKNAAEMFEIS